MNPTSDSPNCVNLELDETNTVPGPRVMTDERREAIRKLKALMAKYGESVRSPILAEFSDTSAAPPPA